MSKPTWHYAKNRQKAGPVSLDSLKKKLSLGELGSDALVWTVGWESWKKVSDVPELTVPEPPPLPPEKPPSLPPEKPPIAKESDQGKEGNEKLEAINGTSELRNKMSTTKGIYILIIMVGLLLPVVSLGFVKGYNPVLGFVGSIPRMRVVFVEEETEDANNILDRLRGERPRVTVEEQAISYGYLFALGCILVCLGTAGVLFDPKPIDSRGISRRDKQAKSEEQKPETLGKTIPWW